MLRRMMDRERTNVGPVSELQIPWMTFWSAWGLGVLSVLVCYLFSWLWSLALWLEVTTFSAWWVEFLPYIRVAWTGILMWSLCAFFPAALIFYVRLGLENLLKAWLPYDIVGMFRKNKR